MIREAALVLGLALETKLTRLRLSVAEADFRALEGSGVTIEEDDVVEDPDGLTVARTETMVTVDTRAVLGAAAASLGYTLGATIQGFVEMTSAHAPEACRVFFLEENGVPPHAILPFSSAALTVVVHVDPRVASETNAIMHALGLHVVQLGVLGALDAKSLAKLMKLVSRIRASVDAPSTGDADRATARQKDANPMLVAEYAKTQKDGLFEAATARILEALVESPFVLGNGLRGKPVPDGILVQGADAISYDCKSKKHDHYGLDPKDADQQGRYLAIQKRLEAAGLRGRGIMIFTPHVERADFEKQVRKEFWRKIADEGYQLIVVPATALLRWYELTAIEGPAFRVFFDRPRFWRALVDQELGGMLSEDEETALLGDRAKKLRLVDDDVAEVAWLAGIAGRSRTADRVGDALQQTDAVSPIREKVTRPVVLQAFYEGLHRAKVTLASLSSATGLSERAVTFLVRDARFAAESAHEWGERGVKNLVALQKPAEPDDPKSIPFSRNLTVSR